MTQTNYTSWTYKQNKKDSVEKQLEQLWEIVETLREEVNRKARK